MSELLVTVCITTYNRKILLPLALKSILKQTYKNFEILIIDDCSSDGTKELIENELLGLDSRIKYIRHDKNQGLAIARNTAIYNANGKYFTFCDDDDEWENNYLLEFISIAKNYSDDWCFCCGTKYIKNNKSVSIIYKMEGDLIDYIKKGYVPPVASQFYVTVELLKIGGYNTDIKSGVDHDLWLTLAFHKYKIKSLEKALALPNTNAKLIRMTNIGSKREKGILQSLKIWKKNIIKYLGEEFYQNFYNNYVDNLKIIELKKEILNKNLIRIIIILLSLKNKYKFLKFIYKSVNRKIFLFKDRIIVDKGLFSD